MHKKTMIIPFVALIVLVCLPVSLVAKTQELRMTIPNAPGSVAAQMVQDFADDVAAKSNGRLKITVFGGPTLCPPPQAFSSVVNGVADLAYTTATMTPGIHPLTAMTTLPMMDIPNAPVGSKALMELWRTNEAYQKEWKDVKVFALQAIGGGAVIGTTNKLVKTFEDLKGMRIRVSPGAQTEFMKNAGAQPMNIPITETWESMDKHVIDGYVFSFTAVNDYNLWDVTKNYTIVNLYSPALYIVMNKSKYNGLSDDLKKVMDECGTKFGARLDEWYDDVVSSCVKRAKSEFSDTTYTIPLEEAEKWTEKAHAAWEQWYKLEEKRKRPARETTEAFMKNLEKYKN